MPKPGQSDPTRPPVLDTVSWAVGRLGRRAALRSVERGVAGQLRRNARTVRSVLRQPISFVETDDPNARLLEPLGLFGRRATFATAHWGNYLAALIRVAFALPDGSRFTVIRRDGWNGIDEDALWAGLNGVSDRNALVLRRSSLSGTALLRAMRERHLLVMYDVDASQGRSTVVPFLDRSLRLATGWIDLAWSAEHVVVFVTPDRYGGAWIASAFDPRGYSERSAFHTSVVRAMAFHLERLIRADPSIWFMWNRMEAVLE